MFDLLSGFGFLNNIVTDVSEAKFKSKRNNSRPFSEEMTLTQAMYANIYDSMHNETKKRILAEERMEEETNPKLKKRMKILIENGIYDFSDIDKW